MNANIIGGFQNLPENDIINDNNNPIINDPLLQFLNQSHNNYLNFHNHIDLINEIQNYDIIKSDDDYDSQEN